MLSSRASSVAQNEFLNSKLAQTVSSKFDIDEKEDVEYVQSEVVEDKESVSSVEEAEYDEVEVEAEKENEFDSELNSALDVVRELAANHQESFVNSICDTFSYLNGREPTINDLSAIFARIKGQFAEEAREDESDYNQSDDDEEDSDYDEYDIDDNQQVLKDLYEDESDFDDSDYDPSDPQDVLQGKLDQNEDYSEDESVGNTEDEDEENADWVFGADEESILNADSFDAEYFEAIQCARNQALIDGEKILNIISEQFEQETGKEANDELLEEALDEFVESEYEESDDQEETQENKEEFLDEEAAEVFQSELESALAHVQELGRKQQEAFYESVVQIFAESNGYEPSLNEVYEIFDGIKEDFADEAREQFLSDLDEESEEESDEEIDDTEDSDYDPNDAEDIKQVADDLEEDYDETSEDEEVINID